MMNNTTEAVTVPGFLANGIHTGIKERGIKDLALIFSAVPAKATGVFTTNLFKAAPVLIDMERIKTGMAQAILVNSGNANAATGKTGYEDALAVSRSASKKLDIRDDLVLVASTGIIGHRLPVGKIESGMETLVEGMRPDGIPEAARAIMTTDKFIKISIRRGIVDSREVTVCGIAKGAGMIEPHMATMLSFVMTDADIDAHCLNGLFIQAVNKSLNAITVDGCMSTNDTAIILANGVAGNKKIKQGTKNSVLFREMLLAVLSDLAQAMVRDGEGATKVIEIIVDEAKSVRYAKKVAYAIANSNLVKTAFYGCDANWGRIISAAGSVGINFPIDAVKLSFENIPVFADGCGIGGYETELADIMSRNCITIRLNLGMGNKEYRIFASDLTLEYIKINAHYRT
jgi:glutamate N-acetyltransferase/amino-acid N-acetyltransferase